MKLEQYGIALTRITENDLELVRQWRNMPHIIAQMAYRKHISKSAQKEWFRTVDNPNNYYLIISTGDEKIGVINIKNINIQDKWGEGGIFIWDKKYWNTHIPVLASLCLLNFVFLDLKITNKSFVKILKENTQAIRFNRQLGYVLAPYQEKEKNQLYVLTSEDYIQKTEKLRKAASIVSGDYLPPRLQGKISDNNLEEINCLL